MDLETILQKLTGYKRIYKKDGTLSYWGMQAYTKLIDLLYNIGAVTEKETDIDTIIAKIDEIDTSSAI